MIISKSVTSIGIGVFKDCKRLSKINVESGNPVYDSRGNCNAIIETATNTLIQGCMNTVIPDNVVSIGDWAFFGSGVSTSMIIPDNVTTIGECAFDSCEGLTSVTIPNSVTIISDFAFYGCKGLTSINIPDSLTVIFNYAFSRCYNLEYVSIPDSVSSFGKGVFEMCDKLSSVKVGMRKPIPIDSDAFTNRSNATLYVPKGRKKAYKRAKFWKEFKEIIEYKVYSHRS